MSDIIIAGYGFVGKAVDNALRKTSQTCIIDPKYNNNTFADFPQVEGIIICVGTPTDENGMCDDSQIRDVIGKTPLHVPILIKSTVTPDKLMAIENDFPDHSICYSPEFLRAATANQDFLNQKYMVIGGEDPECFWQDLFTESLPNCTMFFNCSITEASTVKYAANSFLALKVSFFNQLYDLCEANGAEYNVVRQILTHDNRIGNSHTLVPGVTGERGFGGHCFPKDTSAFASYAKNLNKSLDILEAAINYNHQIRKNT